MNNDVTDIYIEFVITNINPELDEKLLVVKISSTKEDYYPDFKNKEFSKFISEIDIILKDNYPTVSLEIKNKNTYKYKINKEWSMNKIREILRNVSNKYEKFDIKVINIKL